MLTKRKRRFLTAFLVIGLAVWLGSSAIVAGKLTRRSRPRFPEPPPTVGWAEFEGHTLETSDGQQIGGWLVRGDQHKGCVLLLHGNGESRRQMLPGIQLLAQARFTVLAISLRGHGDSSGERNDIGWSARHDVVAAVAFLKRECPGQEVFIVGRSLGSAAAIFAAQELGGKVAGYVLEQPYKDLDSAVWNRLENHLLPIFDSMAYLGLRLWSPLFLPVSPRQISPFEQITNIPGDVPVLILTGSTDQHARLCDVKDVYDQVASHAQLIVFDGAAHVPLHDYDPRRYEATLLDFLGQ